MSCKNRREEDFRQAQDNYYIFLDGLAENKTELRILELNLSASANGRYFDGKDIQGRLGDLKQQLRVAESRIAQGRQDLENARRRLKYVTVVAPAAGTIYAVYHHAGENLTPNMTVLSIDTGEGYSVVGSLLPDESVFVRPGMTVDVQLPTERRAIKGRIEALGRRAMSAGNEGSVTVEAAAQTVPFKVVFDAPMAALTPGLRAAVEIRLSPLARLRPR